jgi:hypothetical protein
VLTVNAAREVTRVAGVVVNRYPAEAPGVAEETNLRAIERWGRVPLLCVLPDEPRHAAGKLGDGVVAAVYPVDWQGIVREGGAA